jgi:hypothetical protein
MATKLTPPDTSQSPNAPAVRRDFADRREQARQQREQTLGSASREFERRREAVINPKGGRK